MPRDIAVDALATTAGLLQLVRFDLPVDRRPGQLVMESYRTDPLDRAVARVWAAGITVVVSAGNRGRTVPNTFTINAPGNSPYVITVGAMNDLDTASRSD